MLATRTYVRVWEIQSASESENKINRLLLLLCTCESVEGCFFAVHK